MGKIGQPARLHMIKKTLGRTGLEVSQLGYGSMGLRGPNTWGVRVVEEDAGINVCIWVVPIAEPGHVAVVGDQDRR